MKKKRKQIGKYKPETQALQFHDMPAETVRQFKAWCTIHDTTMKSKVIELFEETIKR